MLFRRGYLVRYVTHYDSNDHPVEDIDDANYYIERDAIPMIPVPPTTPGIVDNISRSQAAKFYKPGKHFTTSAVAHTLGLNATDQQTPFFNPAHTDAQGLLITQPYKQIMDKAIAAQIRLNEKQNNPNIKLYDADHSGEQVVNGSGGCPTKMGEHAPAPNHDNKGDAFIQIPLNQESCGPITLPRNNCGANKGLREQMCEDKRIFLYFWDEWKLFGKEQYTEDHVSAMARKDAERHDGKSTICRFVDTMYCSSFAYGSDNRKDVSTEFKNYSSAVRKHIWYRCNNHCKLTCRPFFADKDYTLIKTREKDPDFLYTQLVFHSTTREGVYFNLPFGNAEKLFELPTEEAMATEEEVDDDESSTDDDDTINDSSDNRDTTNEKSTTLDVATGVGNARHNCFCVTSLLQMVADQDHLLRKYVVKNDDESGIHDATVCEDGPTNPETAHNYVTQTQDNLDDCSWNDSCDDDSQDQDICNSDILPSQRNSNDNMHVEEQIGDGIEGVSDIQEEDDFHQSDIEDEDGFGSDIEEEEGYNSDEEYDELMQQDADEMDPGVTDKVKETLEAAKQATTNDPTSVSNFNNAILADFEKTIGASMRLGAKGKKKGTTMNLEELAAVVKFCQAAGAYRYNRLGDCLVEVKDDVTGENVLPASPLMVDSLGVALRVNPHPMANRALDAVSIALRREAIRMKWILPGKKVRNLDPGEDNDMKILGDAMFAGIALRFSGRVSRFALFSAQENNKNNTFLPKGGADLEFFLQFVAASTKPCPRRKHVHSMSAWLSRQHLESIPKHIRNSHAMFSLFLKKTAEGKDKMVNAMQSVMERRHDEYDTRDLAVRELKEMLEQFVGNSTKGNLHFMAQQVVSDMENIFGNLFGDVRSATVVGGHAGTLGYTCMVWKKKKDCKETFPQMLDKIIDYVQGENMTDDELLILGYYRDDSNGMEPIVRNMVNDLCFSATDAEHWLCKGWIIIKKTFNHYRNSKYPTPLEPHLHPIKWPSVQIAHDIMSDETIDSIMERIVSMYEELTEFHNLMLPDLFVVE